jgi:hypothetical protein
MLMASIKNNGINTNFKYFLFSSNRIALAKGMGFNSVDF